MTKGKNDNRESNSREENKRRYIIVSYIYIFFVFQLKYINLDETYLKYLHIIEESHPDMLKLYEHIRYIASKNFNGVVIYLSFIHQYYNGLLSNCLLPLIEQILLQTSQLDIPASIFNEYFI